MQPEVMGCASRRPATDPSESEQSLLCRQCFLMLSLDVWGDSPSRQHGIAIRRCADRTPPLSEKKHMIVILEQLYDVSPVGILRHGTTSGGDAEKKATLRCNLNIDDTHNNNHHEHNSAEPVI